MTHLVAVRHAAGREGRVSRGAREEDRVRAHQPRMTCGAERGSAASSPGQGESRAHLGDAQAGLAEARVVGDAEVGAHGVGGGEAGEGAGARVRAEASGLSRAERGSKQRGDEARANVVVVSAGPKWRLDHTAPCRSRSPLYVHSLSTSLATAHTASPQDIAAAELDDELAVSTASLDHLQLGDHTAPAASTSAIPHYDVPLDDLVRPLSRPGAAACELTPICTFGTAARNPPAAPLVHAGDRPAQPCTVHQGPSPCDPPPPRPVRRALPDPQPGRAPARRAARRQGQGQGRHVRRRAHRPRQGRVRGRPQDVGVQPRPRRPARPTRLLARRQPRDRARARQEHTRGALCLSLSPSLASSS